MSKNVISKEQAKEICAKVTNIADFCREVGWQPRGDNYKIFHKYVKEYNLDTSHFTGNRTNIGNRLGCGKVLSDEEFFTKNKLIKTSTIIKRLIDKEYKEYKCECCNINEWQGKPLTLQLHHINGDHMDNRLENLQLLCPNCHSQTDSYAGKNNQSGKGTRVHTLPPKHTCSVCGKALDRATKTGMCKECYKKSTSRLNNSPSEEELLKKRAELKSYEQMGKFYNVSGSTVRKWFKARNLI